MTNIAKDFYSGRETRHLGVSTKIGDFPNSDALRDLVPFVQFKKREKNPWRSVTFSKVAGFQYKWYQMAQDITYKVSKRSGNHEVTPIKSLLY